jgi:hypothetical protein
MRTAFLPVLVMFGGVLVEDTKALTFCAVNNQGSAANCAFTSVTACREEVKGDGGFCIPEAPIGHRQPRAADVPGGGDDTVNARQDQRNRKLDRSLRFCRGC